jgi:hypothetical protein
VVVATPRCDPESFRLGAFLDALRVELAPSGLSCCTLVQPGTQSATVARLGVQIELVPCSTDADRVQVSVRVPGDPRVAEREVFLADVEPAARPRALALAVAELVRSREQNVRTAPPGAVPKVARTAPASVTPQTSNVAHPVALSARVEAEARQLPARETTMWGGRVGLTGRWRSAHAEFDLGGGSARAHDELGEVLLRGASAGLGCGPRLVYRPVLVDLGLRAELGWGWIRGEPAREGVHAGAGSDLMSSLGLRLSLEVPAPLPVRPSFGLEGGGVVRALEGEAGGHPAVGVTGYYVLAAVGVAVTL